MQVIQYEGKVNNSCFKVSFTIIQTHSMQHRLDLNPARALDCIKAKSSQYSSHADLTVLHQV